jgi:hypothetical protein
MKSERLEYNISLMPYEITRWFSFYCHPFHIHFIFYTQTLTTLQLDNNGIREAGSQYLADALRNNMVILILFSSLSYSSSFLHLDTHLTAAWWQSNRRSWITISRWHLAKQHGNSDPSFIARILSSSLHIDTQHIEPSSQSNRSCGGTTSCECLSK